MKEKYTSLYTNCHWWSSEKNPKRRFSLHTHVGLRNRKRYKGACVIKISHFPLTSEDIMANCELSNFFRHYITADMKALVLLTAAMCVLQALVASERSKLTILDLLQPICLLPYHLTCIERNSHGRVQAQRSYPSLAALAGKDSYSGIAS